jgi:hypothetical protein
MLDGQARPQILEHLSKSLTLTVYETRCVRLMCAPVCVSCMQALSPACPPPWLHRWIPGSAKFVALGSFARNTGSLQVRDADERPQAATRGHELNHLPPTGVRAGRGRAESSEGG